MRVKPEKIPTEASHGSQICHFILTSVTFLKAPLSSDLKLLRFCAEGDFKAKSLKVRQELRKKPSLLHHVLTRSEEYKPCLSHGVTSVLLLVGLS